MIDFSKTPEELETQLNRLISNHYIEYLEEGLYLEHFSSSDINNYLNMLYQMGYSDVNELNFANIRYVFNSKHRTLIKIVESRYSLKVSKYIIDSNELDKYAYYINKIQ